jgi:hypothetical protein
MRNASPSFNGYEHGPDFDRARSQIATPFQYVDIALDVAAVNQVYNISGDFLYVDAVSSGTATLELNNQYNDAAAPFQISPGFGLNALFKQVKLSWTAQAGKRLRLMYSTGDRVVPTNSTSINGTVSVTQSGFSYTNAYKSSTLMAANTPDTIFTPGANANGAIVWSAEFVATITGSNQSISYLAKTSAPTTAIDGDVICVATSQVGAAFAGKLNAPVQIAAGKGLYYISTGGESGVTLRGCLYSLL